MDGGAGFTLIELVIVIVVISIAGLLLAVMFREAIGTYRFVDVEADLLQQARFAEERIAREMRRLRDGNSVTTASAQTFAFVDRDAVPIVVSWSGTKGADLLFTRNGVPQALAAGVDSLAFAYFKEDGTAAAPVVAPSATDIRRVAVYLRLARGGQSIATLGAAALRAL
ncbi:MAG: prepilin-type N-terminal cleavage/methylation domain-containing protein [Candidatus Eisenbacteria bacterium]